MNLMVMEKMKKMRKKSLVLDEWRETVDVGFGWEVNVEA